MKTDTYRIEITTITDCVPKPEIIECLLNAYFEGYVISVTKD